MARLTIEFFNSLDLSGDVVHTQTVERLHAMWFGEVASGRQPRRVLGTPDRYGHTAGVGRYTPLP